MSPREFVDMLYIPANKDARKCAVQGLAGVTCPLGCGRQVVYLPDLGKGWENIIVVTHRQTHPNSVSCYWSGKRLLALQGLDGVDVILRKE